MSSFHKILIVRGTAAVCAHATLLEELSARHGQAGAMDWLLYVLRASASWKKHPCLLLCKDAHGDTRWAVLLSELFPGPLSSGIYVFYDVFGLNSVIARESEREAAAIAATRKLMQSGARAVILPWAAPARLASAHRVPIGTDTCWAIRERTSSETLPLRDTYEETLMDLGKSTRFNLRYYRRKLAQALEYKYEEYSAATLPSEEVHKLNRESIYPVSEQNSRLRYELATSTPGGFIVGLRAADGRLLSLVGGRRQGTRTTLVWQNNARGMEKASLGTVMRGHFIEEEIARGAKEITISGGTRSYLAHSLLKETGTELFAVKRSWMRFMQLAVKVTSSYYAWAKTKPYWMEIIFDRSLRWHTADESRPAKSPSMAGSR